MKRKIFISTLAIFFLVSTTGLPVTLHFCSMNETEMSHCKMHSKCMHCMNIEHTKTSGQKIEKKDCCKTEYKYEAISDQFVQINSQKDFHSQNIVAIINFELTGSSFSIFNYQNYFNDTSPPQLINNQIYLNNSILLI